MERALDVDDVVEIKQSVVVTSLSIYTFRLKFIEETK